MPLDYEHARFLEGQLIRFKNKQGDWSVGRVVKAKKDGLEIEALGSSEPVDGYGYFWGGFGAPFFAPYAGFGFAPFFFW